MGNKDCKLCQHYGCKVLVWYVGLCVIAVVAFILLDSWLGLTKVFNKGELVAVVVGLIAWTAAMIVPIAAYYAIADWRKQASAMNTVEYAKDLLSSYLEFRKNLIVFSVRMNSNRTEILNNKIKNFNDLVVMVRDAQDSWNDFQKNYYVNVRQQMEIFEALAGSERFSLFEESFKNSVKVITESLKCKIKNTEIDDFPIWFENCKNVINDQNIKNTDEFLKFIKDYINFTEID